MLRDWKKLKIPPARLRVSKVFAVQAGAEVRVFVSPTEADDLSSVKLSHDIARKIERDLQYPGQIKVLVIRETRAEKFAV